jgi:hypothetical protein
MYHIDFAPAPSANGGTDTSVYQVGVDLAYYTSAFDLCFNPAPKAAGARLGCIDFQLDDSFEVLEVLAKEPTLNLTLTLHSAMPEVSYNVCSFTGTLKIDTVTGDWKSAERGELSVRATVYKANTA